MQIDCPRCTRPVEWDGVVCEPAQVLKCAFCGHRFPSNDPQASMASNPPPTESPMEVWEMDIDGEDPEGLGLDSLLDDFDFVESGEIEGAEPLSPNTPTIERLLQEATNDEIPDLPQTSLALHKLFQLNENNNWNNLIEGFEQTIPALPHRGFDLVEVPYEELRPIQVEAIHPSRQSSHEQFVPLNLGKTNNSFASKPPPGSLNVESEPTSIADILESFVSESPEAEKVEVTRYYIKRNDKEFGPYTEMEVLQLLESRKLTGEEPARLHDDFLWTPLEEFEDFGPTIDVLRKVKVRVGWEKSKRRRATSSASPAPQSSAAATQKSNSPDAKSKQSDSNAAKAKPKRSKLRLALYATLALALLGIGGTTVWQPRPKPVKKIKPKNLRNPTLKKLAIHDHIIQYRNVLRYCMAAFHSGKFTLAWHNVRFAYYFLDSYGDDPGIRAGAERIFQKLRKRKLSKLMLQKIALARAISQGKKVKVFKLLNPIQTKLDSNHYEWGYLLARSLEITGQYDTAQVLYTNLLRSYPRHVRGMLGLYRVYQALYKPYRASSYLLRAFRIAPKHMPSQLAALEYAEKNGTWLTFRKKINKNINFIIAKKWATKSELARWYYLQATQFWRLRKTAKAIYRMDQAITLAPRVRKYRWHRIKFYLWSGKAHNVRQAITDEKDAQKNLQLRIWNFQALLQFGSQADILKRLAPLVQRAGKTPKEKYLLNYMFALSHLKKGNIPDAIDSCENANQVEDHGIKKPFASLLLLNLYSKQKQWNKVDKQLKFLREMKYSSTQSKYYQGLLLLQKNDAKEAAEVAKLLQQKTPTHHLGYMLAAEIARSQKKFGRALVFYRKALLYHPVRPSPVLIKMGDLSFQFKKYANAYRLYERYRKMMSRTPGCRLTGKRIQALFHLKKYKDLLAIPVKECATYTLHLTRGQCAEFIKNEKLALKEYNIARRLNSKGQKAIQAIADLYYKQKKFKQAINLYQQLNRKHPRKRIYLLRLLRLHRRFKRFRKASIMLRRYNNVVAPKNDFDLKMEELHLYIASKAWKAPRLLRKLKALFTKPKQVLRILYAEAKLYRQQKKSKLAIKTYSKLLQNHPSEANALYERGRLYLKSKNYKKCYADIVKFLALKNSQHKEYKTALIIKRYCKRKR